MDEAPPRSLFVVVSYGVSSPCSTSILQLDTQGHNPDFAALLERSNGAGNRRRHRSGLGYWVRRRASFSEFATDIVDQKEYVAHFGIPQVPANIQWVFSHPTGDEDLYLLPYWNPQKCRIDAVLRGFIFNLKTKICRPLSPPVANKSGGHVANLDGYLYFIAAPCWSDCTPHPSFERYDLAHDKWETLQPFPFDDSISKFSHIVATAVWYDNDTKHKILLFNMGCKEIWAYLVGGNKWYPVDVGDNLCYTILGEAIVVENTIYALSTTNFILALSIRITECYDGGLVLKCFLLSKIFVQGMKPFSIVDGYLFTRHLCHLGKDNFCLVESCQLYEYCDYQPIRLTNIKLKMEEKSMTVTGVRGHLLRILDGQQFRVNSCFSLPDSNTIASKEGQSYFFDLNPFTEGFDPHKKNINLEPEEKIVTASDASTSLGDGAACGRSNTEGRFIQLCQLRLALSPSVTYRKLEEMLKKFGPLEDMILVMEEGGEVSAIVEFECATSFLNEIKASPIVIEGCRLAVVELEEKRLPAKHQLNTWKELN